METQASFESSVRLSCAIPSWGSMFTATSLLLKLRSDGTAIDKHTFGLQYIPVYESWVSHNASIGDASGGTVIRIEARGLIKDLAALPYECVFSDISGGVALSEPVSSLSPSELMCISPQWGRKYTAAPVLVTLYNRVRGLVVPHSGIPGSNTFEFTESWMRAQEFSLLASGGDLFIIGVGLRMLMPYRCLLESNVTKRIVSDLAYPTSPSTVACKMSAWGRFYEAAMVNITLMDGYGLHVFFSGLPVLRQVEVRESWLSIQPTYFWANAGMTVTVQGYGFNSQRLYNCSLTYMARGHWDTVYNPEKWSPGKSVLQEQIMTVPTVPLDHQTVVCILPQWGSLFAARTATLSLTSIGLTSRELAFVGSETAADILMDPTWKSITPTRYGWVGLGAITGALLLWFAET